MTRLALQALTGVAMVAAMAHACLTESWLGIYLGLACFIFIVIFEIAGPPKR